MAESARNLGVDRKKIDKSLRRHSKKVVSDTYFQSFTSPPSARNSNHRIKNGETVEEHNDESQCSPINRRRGQKNRQREASAKSSKAVSEDKAASLENFELDQNSRLHEDSNMLEVKFGSKIGARPKAASSLVPSAEGSNLASQRAQSMVTIKAKKATQSLPISYRHSRHTSKVSSKKLKIKEEPLPLEEEDKKQFHPWI